MNLARLKRTSAEVLAAAVFETFPSVSLLGGSDTLSGFYYDFYFPHPIHPELHLQIEEKMRPIAREKREISDLEMVGVSAREFLKSRGHFDRAEQIEGGGLFSIVKIGDFADLSYGDHEKNSSCISHFKLFAPVLLENRGLRIFGAVYESKEKLKEFLKRWNSYPKKRHEKVGIVKKYWNITDLGFVWYPNGVKARKDLLCNYKENLLNGADEILCYSGADRDKLHMQLLSELGGNAVFEIFPIRGEVDPIEDAGLFLPREGEAIQMTLPLKNITSCLHSIEKTLNILAFNYFIRFTPALREEAKGKILVEALEGLNWEYERSDGSNLGPKLEFCVEDGLGRPWSSIEVLAKECLIVRVVVERNLALLLEIQEFI